MILKKILHIVLTVIVISFFTRCEEKPLTIKYKTGTFPDTVITISDLNSQYDDYNMDIEASVISSNFLSALTRKFNTTGNDFGPYRFFNSHDGLEYMVTASESAGNGLDLVFSKYTPAFSNIPPIPDPVPATLFNSASDDAYITLNSRLDTAYFCSDRSGNFNIYIC